MINLTDSALNAVKSVLATSAQPTRGLRIMVEAGGCAGFKYAMDLAEQAKPNETVIERDGIRVFVDDMSRDHLAGTTIDFVVKLEGSGFTFDNPNAGSICSCGKSFS
ncbi:iron-binding apoprotein IscA [Bradyrhizobium macuxiense]|uniref:Iron-binding apoprotein IscA n=1 Tax=Bradyrhizobium macuxiense TaxID=1755647 RepID=A0A560L209_9BRAD|nr:iron-sulfur cluster assembly accessory protein [Bradyrhizobium macuxiense]TWB89392.1 iron-binding apoprotein IscA [Bradyrhizobium macuxiense]